MAGTPLYPEFNEEQESDHNVSQTPEENVQDGNIGLPHLDLEYNPELLDSVEEEVALWSSHPCTTSVLVDQKPRLVNDPVQDIIQHEPKPEQS